MENDKAAEAKDDSVNIIELLLQAGSVLLSAPQSTKRHGTQVRRVAGMLLSSAR